MRIGIDIGGTKCAVVKGETVNGAFSVTGRVCFETERRTPTEVLSRFDDAINDFVMTAAGSAKVGEGVIESIGISCGGPLDSVRGVILSPPNLPGWDHIEIVRHFKERFGVPTALENDANACALAEWRYGAGRGTKNMIFLTFGTGLGAGLILNGALYGGTNGMAGEVGHIRLNAFGPAGYGKCGSFEGFCSGAGIAAFAREMAREARQRGISPCYAPADGTPFSAKDVAEAARRGDDTALKVMRICGEQLGAGLAILMDILNPEAIVIGSIFARSRDLLWEHAERVIHAEALEQSRAVCRVTAAELGEQIGDYAALAVAEAALSGRV